LTHEGSFDHYIPILLEEFYDSFTINGIDDHTQRIPINWTGDRKVVTLQMILDLTKITFDLGLNQIPMRVEECMSLMSESYRMATHRDRCENSFS